jgi:hypothetical protein
LVEAFLNADIPRFKTLAEKDPSSLDAKVHQYDQPLHRLLRKCTDEDDVSLIMFILWTYPPAAVSPTVATKPTSGSSNEGTGGSTEQALVAQMCPLHLAASNKRVPL